MTLPTPPEPPLKRLSQYFFRGLITFLPLAITVYVLVLFVTWTERTAMAMLRPVTGDFYLPGLGIALGALVQGWQADARQRARIECERRGHEAAEHRARCHGADLPADQRRAEIEFHFAMQSTGVPALLALLHRHGLLRHRSAVAQEKRRLFVQINAWNSFDACIEWQEQLRESSRKRRFSDR